MRKLSCADARQIDLVDYLAALGFRPQQIRGTDYWYRSPLREEKTASFKVNRKKNIYYDHGTGEGGTIIDFGVRYFKCSIADFLNRLSTYQSIESLSFHPPTLSTITAACNAGEKENDTGKAGRIIITDTRPLATLH